VYVVWIYCFKFIAEKGESMINTNIYNYVNVLNKAADAANTRNTLISNNIANVATPNYKRKDIDFESVLQAELAGEKSLDKAVARANQDLSVLDPQVYTDNSSLSYRTDGNNVDIATEEAYLAENQIRYQALVDLMTQEFSRYNTVLSSGS
jgi:flagellar basal-body rod protein FlgB